MMNFALSPSSESGILPMDRMETVGSTEEKLMRPNPLSLHMVVPWVRPTV